MADRRLFPFRFWTSTQRRKYANQEPGPSPPIQSKDNATNPTNPVDHEPQTSSPAATPSHPTSQSRSPQKPSQTPRKKPLSRSPKLPSSPSSIKRVQPNSPPKRSVSKSNVASFMDKPKPATSQHEPLQLQQPADIKKDNVHDTNGLSTNLTNITLNEKELVPPFYSDGGTTTIPTQTRKPSQSLDTSNQNEEHVLVPESSVNPEETEEVKVVVEQVMKKENMEDSEKETNGFLTSRTGSEARTTKNLDTGSFSNPIHVEKEEMKPGTTPTNDKQSAQPRGVNVPLHQEIKEDLSTFLNKMASGDPKISVHDKPVSVITLAGENRGASMHLGSDSSSSDGPIHIHRSYKIDHNELSAKTMDLESHSKHANKENNPGTLEDQPAETYVNNNAQSINNSLVFNCSISERNPGVHLVLANVPKESVESRANIQKAEFSKTTAEKVTYEPRIRRRCLQGLFLEPSDSETEHMEKPRRHGCRVGCQTMVEDDNIDVR
ncbi:hypothetical protein F511_13660 [Dorcoceras hygrometricum]|uniref:Uncharacterized protein n=1 Tax=Dorcoceras hygrometricum TaxID=472368 RepID=A0A2Z7B500_9LAMI|nr:hypothetical protein F511_13660 [Dorcoceras hygrometricum]